MSEGSLDETLYSRQLYVIGHDAMFRIVRSKILIVGCDGLGIELAKNVILAGVKEVTLYDKELVSETDLGSGFYFSRTDIGKHRDEAALTRLGLLNRYVNVNVNEKPSFSDYSIVVYVNQSHEAIIEANDKCREMNIKFISVKTCGLFLNVFCDLNSHICMDKTGTPLYKGMFESITTDGVLTLAHGLHHTLDNGDVISIGNKEYTIEVISRKQIQLIGKSFEASDGGEFEEVRKPHSMTFEPYSKAICYPEILTTDISEVERALYLHYLFTGFKVDAKDPYKSKRSDEEVRKMWKTLESKYENLREQFEFTKDCSLMPICSIAGGFGAQEVIKACSLKFLPLKQFFYYDCANTFTNTDFEQPNIGRYYAYEKCFGKNFENIKSANIFLVGAGAIGCENLKNFVMSGLGHTGCIYVTDMDSIEQSNLNRQFLFRQEDIGKMKAEAAIRQASSLNEDFGNKLAEEIEASESQSSTHSPNIGLKRLKADIANMSITRNMISFNLAACAKTEDVFSDKFLNTIDVISNALDNVEARMYVDERSVKMCVPMIDAGTLGTKGHVQSSIPFKTENYSSSVDPPAKSIAQCTIKRFPFSMEHCIEWALAEFETHFENEPKDVKDYKENRNPLFKQLYDEAPRTVHGCLRKSMAIFVDIFHEPVRELLETFPFDYVTKEGAKFWAPPKKLPKLVNFYYKDVMHQQFVCACANVIAECYGVREITLEETIQYLENCFNDDDPEPIQFPERKNYLEVIKPLMFDKDMSKHVDFIHIASNIRATIYSIPNETKHYIVGVAGKIIPAIATTTAVISGFATMEIIKYILNGEAKNSFVDLAMPFCAIIDPIEPRKYECIRKGQKVEYNLWSRLPFADQCLEDFLKDYKEKTGNEVSMIGSGKKILYWDLNPQNYESNMKKKFSELCDKKEGDMLEMLDVISSNGDDSESIAVRYE